MWGRRVVYFALTASIAPNILWYEVGDIKCFGLFFGNQSSRKPQSTTNIRLVYMVPLGHCTYQFTLTGLSSASFYPSRLKLKCLNISDIGGDIPDPQDTSEYIRYFGNWLLFHIQLNDSSFN
jgi:hypothetical protein